MLRIERIEISGFKSFSDRTRVDLPPGITAVVGPNGCGKSNIGDAINWVLGEQSAKLLRGEHMADVIFNGSEARKAVGMAEVSLQFVGAEGLKQADQGRVSVTRRLFRDGESEYLLNGQRTRLRDIQDLLREARVGARTYATIEQGKIDMVLNARPKDRRALIEDAAGVSGYKHKRRLAELKLEATQANLLRVNDIVGEVARQINSLKRQAAKARRYRRLREALREKERVRFGRRAFEMEQELRRLSANETLARDQEQEVSTRLQRLEAGLAEERDALEAARRAFREAAEHLHQLELSIDREQAQIAACRQRIAEAGESAKRQRAEAERLGIKHQATLERAERHGELVGQGRARVAELAAALERQQSLVETAEHALSATRTELERLRGRQLESMARAADSRNRWRSIEEALERAVAQRARLAAERGEAREEWSRFDGEARTLTEQAGQHGERLSQLRVSCAESERALSDCRERQDAGGRALAEAREQEQSALACLTTLEDVNTRFAGVSDGVRSLLASGSSVGIRTSGVVADYIEASRDVEGVAESYLQWLLPTVILEDDSDARRAAALLRAEGAGCTWLISRTQPAGALAIGTSRNGRGELSEILDDARVLGRLRDRLTLKTTANGVLASRIGDAVLVDSLESALDLHRLHPDVDYLTPGGEVVYASGVISVGGSRNGDQGLLAHKRRTTEARVLLEQAASRSAELTERVGKAREEAIRLEAEQRERQQELERAERRDLELQLHVERSAIEAQRSGRRSAILAEELAAVELEAERLGEERRVTAAVVEEAEQAQQTLERSFAEHAQLAGEREIGLRQLAEEAARLRAELAANRQLQQTLEEEGRRLGQQASELHGAIETHRAEAAAAEERERTAAELEARTESDLATHLQEQSRLAASAGEMERDIDERQQRLTEQESATRGLRGELESLREATRGAELERARAEAARQHLDDLCAQELGMTAAAAAAAVADPLLALDLDALEAEIQQIRQRIEQIGPVNMTAIDEFTELEARHGFLTTQREDLLQSMESLKETIRRINRQSRERFAEAFESIRQSYQEIYKLLFNGGRADLRLEEGEDVLESGIEILAQPPGKKLASVQLLSGGEKALSAIALLFAIFRYQPSPFCLLDEVDAALDDANVARFARMIREYAHSTQFIIITHNKLSMESADLLYGVTMAEPGVSKVVSLQLQ